MRGWRITIALLGMGILCMPAFGVNPARPGTVNYIEGAAYVEGNQGARRINDREVGTLALGPGQVLSTGVGKAEILLTPGIFLRMDDHSAVKMISPDITPTKVELERGRASVEVDEIFKQNVVQIVDGGVTTQLIKDGYYEFDANHPTVLVFKGQAEADTGDGKWQEVKGHHSMALAPDARTKPVKFNAEDAEGELYNWSSLRSEYLAEANNQIAGEYAGMAGFYPGWYWDPWAWDYTFIGMDPFWSPFGWGFYPPRWGGFYGGSYGGGFYGPGYPGRGVRGGGGRYGGWPHGGGFQGGGGFHGGGFGGGFHGGGMGGGFHGGGGGRR
jgi:hypothetical protein